MFDRVLNTSQPPLTYYLQDKKSTLIKVNLFEI